MKDSKAYIKSTEHIKDLNLTEKEIEISKALFREAYETERISSYMIGTRYRNVVETHIAIAVAIRSNLFTTYMAIGKIFKKNHATIIHYMKVHDEVLRHDKKYMELYRRLEDIVRAKIDEDRWSEKSIDFKDDDKDVIIKRLRSENARLRLNLNKVKDDLYNIKSIVE